jgi:hypothetical protein
MLKVAPGGDAGSAYAVWGWRIPFVIGALLAGALFVPRRGNLWVVPGGCERCDVLK